MPKISTHEGVSYGPGEPDPAAAARDGGPEPEPELPDPTPDPGQDQGSTPPSSSPESSGPAEPAPKPAPARAPKNADEPPADITGSGGVVLEKPGAGDAD